MFFVVRSNDGFNFPLGLIKYIVIVTYTGYGIHLMASWHMQTQLMAYSLRNHCIYRHRSWYTPDGIMAYTQVMAYT